MNKPIPYNEVKIIDRDTIKFGDPIYDNFISTNGGVELSTMIALAGTSGAGKTTLTKKWQKDLQAGEKSVFFALESKKSSVARQTKRIETGEDELICDEDTFPKWSQFMDYIHEEKPLMVVVDSLQHAATLLSKENKKYKYDNYKEIIKDLYDWKDDTGGVVILICQLNEEGKMEGPASTLFDVDCSIKLTANNKTGERYMETLKNRMGATGKLFYEFVSTEVCIKFYTVDQWMLKKTNFSLSEFITSSIENYLGVLSYNKNYSKFRKEFTKEYRKIYNEDISEIERVTKTLQLIEELKYLLD